MEDTAKIQNENKAYNEGRVEALTWALRLVEDMGRFGLEKVVKALKEETNNVTQNHLL